MIKHFLHLSLLILSVAILSACSDEDTSIGENLIDPSIIYNGKSDTLFVDTAFSIRDDSLLTQSTSFGIIGRYTDPLFGLTVGELYTQISLTTAATTIDLGSVQIDSAVLSIATDSIYPRGSANYSFNLCVQRLQENIYSDSTYYSFSSLPTEETYFSGEVQLTDTTRVFNIRLSESIYPLLQFTGSRVDFEDQIHGLALRPSASAADDEGLIHIDISSSKTKLRVFYTYNSDTSHYDFNVAKNNRFFHYVHTYHNSILNSGRTIDGASTLYIQPLGGFGAVLKFNRQIASFRTAHPKAVIHYADLLLPIADDPAEMHPARLVATTSNHYIIDYGSSGVDGYFDSTAAQYRIRIPQHLQGVLRSGLDNGIKILIDNRSSTSAPTLLSGYSEADPSKKIRIALVYTE